MGQYWINTLLRPSWEKEKNANKFMIGTVDKWAPTVKSLKKGDYVMYYLAGGESRICGVFRVKSEYYYDEDVFWDQDVFPHRAKLEPILIADKKDKEVNIRHHIARLGFIKDKNTWGPSFRAHLRRIPKADFEYLVERLEENTERKPPSELDTWYVPRVIAELPLLAKEHTEEMEEFEGPPKDELEKRLWLAFRMLGFEVEELGHKAKGSDPDGIAKARDDRFAIIFDAKVRREGFAISANDKRAAIDYINHRYKKLEQLGMHSVFFTFISGEFKGAYQSKIKEIVKETKAKAVSLLKAEFLPKLIERRWKKPDYVVGDIEELFFKRGEITEKDIEALDL